MKSYESQNSLRQKEERQSRERHCSERQNREAYGRERQKKERQYDDCLPDLVRGESSENETEALFPFWV
jgi:hypothetical protein